MDRNYLDELTTRSLDLLCDYWSENPEKHLDLSRIAEDLGVEWKVAEMVQSRLVGIHALTAIRGSVAGAIYVSHQISPSIVEVADQWKEYHQLRSGPSDHVSAFEQWARTNPLVAKLVICIVVLTAVVTLLNQGVELLQRLGVFK